MGKVPHCPACDCLLMPSQACQLRFDCPGCGTSLRPLRKPAYRWLRVLGCYGAGIAAARFRGWDWWFIVFVVSFYALPAAFLFDSIVLNFFPARQFEPVPGKFQMLELSARLPDEFQL
jgi:hypothetical protein